MLETPEPLELFCRINTYGVLEIVLQWLQIFPKPKLGSNPETYEVNMRVATDEKMQNIFETATFIIPEEGNQPPNNEWHHVPVHQGVYYEFDVVAKKGTEWSIPTKPKKIAIG
jgi:phosphodiesterase/alkaline phosphatase D-like protein